MYSHTFGRAEPIATHLHITREKQLTQELFVLPEDLAYVTARMAKLEEEIRALGGDFGDAFTQSSETWHDNAPFEAVRDKQSQLAAELATMKKIRAHSALVLPKTKRGRVGYGSIVTLDNGKRYKLAGDWTPHAGHSVDGVVVVSSQSPIGKTLLGKKLQEPLQIGAHKRVVTSISYTNSL